MIVWCDLETTGLDSKKGSILEIVMVATDDNLVQVGEPFVSLVKPLHRRGFEAMDDFVRNMHVKSGLIDQIYRTTTEVDLVLRDDLPRLGDVERAAIEWLYRIMHPTENLLALTRATPLAGNSVHFDKRWLIEHMDDLEALFSHRIFDVSVMTEFAKRYAPAVYAARPGLGLDGKPLPAHRALDDILNSIETARYYRDQLGRSA